MHFLKPLLNSLHLDFIPLTDTTVSPHIPTLAKISLPFAAAAPSFADMGNAIGSLIMMGKGQEQEGEEDSVLLSEEHSLILTCCWVSVKVRRSCK